jgi:hypothetical protein
LSAGLPKQEGIVTRISDKCRKRGISGSFGIHVVFLTVVDGGFFFKKKTLERVLSVRTDSETAVGGAAGKLRGWWAELDS